MDFADDGPTEEEYQDAARTLCILLAVEAGHLHPDLAAELLGDSLDSLKLCREKAIRRGLHEWRAFVERN